MEEPVDASTLASERCWPWLPPFKANPPVSCRVQAVLGLPYGSPIDLWSVGVLVAEAALKQPLLPCRTPAEALQAVSGEAESVQVVLYLRIHVLWGFC